MSETEKSVREIRLNPIVPSESVLVATARSMRPKKAEAPARAIPARTSRPARSAPATRP
jgi:UDPglucose--hexose-1-phosphate uridylyltransferase